jgi:hypothetical protein
VVFGTELLAETEVGAAPTRTELLEHAIDAQARQLAEQEIGREVRVAEEGAALP